MIPLFCIEKDTRVGVAAHYGKFENVKNYIAVVGKKSADLSEKAGYYGEKLVLVIAIGYGKTQGAPRKSKTSDKVCSSDVPAPEWFVKGVNAALKAPTAFNQQKIFFTLKTAPLRQKPTWVFTPNLTSE